MELQPSTEVVPPPSLESHSWKLGVGSLIVCFPNLNFSLDSIIPFVPIPISAAWIMLHSSPYLTPLGLAAGGKVCIRKGACPLMGFYQKKKLIETLRCIALWTVAEPRFSNFTLSLLLLSSLNRTVIAYTLRGYGGLIHKHLVFGENRYLGIRLYIFLWMESVLACRYTRRIYAFLLAAVVWPSEFS